MKLNFAEVTGNGLHFHINEFCWRDKNDTHKSAVVAADVKAVRIDTETILLTGQMLGKRMSLCDRCGEECEFALQGDFVYRITTAQVDFSGLPEVECTDEDSQTLYLSEPEIELDEILREQILLAIPLQTLCRDNCRGICAGCGAGLNHEPCSCASSNSNSPFAVLGKLGKP